MYRITAVITKAGGLPVNWVRHSKNKMTKKECEELFFRRKEAGRSYGDKIAIENFLCVAVDK